MISPKKKQFKKYKKKYKNKINRHLLRIYKRYQTILLIFNLLGFIIILSIPFYIIDENYLLFEDKIWLGFWGEIALLIAPIFFGFCLFKLFEWKQEWIDGIENNIEDNINFTLKIEYKFAAIRRKLANTSKNSLKSIFKRSIDENDDVLSYLINDFIQTILGDFKIQNYKKDIILIPVLQDYWNIIAKLIDIIVSDHPKEDILELMNKKKSNIGFYKDIELIVKSLLKSIKNLDSKELIFPEILFSISSIVNNIGLIRESFAILLSNIQLSGLGTKKEKQAYKNTVKNYMYISNSHSLFLNPKKLEKLFS